MKHLLIIIGVLAISCNKRNQLPINNVSNKGEILYIGDCMIIGNGMDTATAFYKGIERMFRPSITGQMVMDSIIRKAKK